MKRKMPFADPVDISSDDDSCSGPAKDEGCSSRQSNTIDKPLQEKKCEGIEIRRAKMYQEYMKQIPVPTNRASVIPCTSWTGLAKSIKQLYGQPLHYLTNICLKKWDQLRIGGEDEHQPLDSIIHPCKAEATIWRMEEVHRLTTSHHTLAKSWLADPMSQAYIDSIVPKL